MKTLVKIDKFYYAFGLMLLVMSILVILTLRTLFSSYYVSQGVSDELLEASTPRINKTNVGDALEKFSSPNIVTLDL